MRSPAVMSSEPATLCLALSSATGLKVIALVGQETMHSPHCTQLESPIGSFTSKPIPAAAPLPVRAMTLFSRTSLHPRTQRSQRTHALWSIMNTGGRVGDTFAQRHFRTGECDLIGENVEA